MAEESYFPRERYDSLPDRNLFVSLDRRISRFLSIDGPICLDPSVSSAYLESIDDLLLALPRLPSNPADDLISRAMFRLTEEFRLLMEKGPESYHRRRLDSANDLLSDQEEEEEELEDDQIPVAQLLTDFDVVIDALPPSTVADLQKFAKRLLNAGFGESCSHAYSDSRREFLRESMGRLGIVKINMEEFQRMQWEEVEYHIGRWTTGLPVVLRILFPSERRLCERVFFEFPAAAEICFAEATRDAAMQLLSFADAVAVEARAPERLFKLLDMYETLRNILPEFDANFSDQCCLFIRSESVAVWKRMGEGVKGIFMELESLIRRDPANAAIPGGSVHPITRYVLNYLRSASESRETLEQIFEEGEEMTSTFSDQVIWIVDLLESNLKMKSEAYENKSLRQIFMMNNANYIYGKMMNSALGLMLGEEWLMKNSAKVRAFQGSYLRATWKPIQNLLAGEGGGGVKDVLRQFNAQFMKVCSEQGEWVIYDEQLRKSIRDAIAGEVLVFYRRFLDRFRTASDGGIHADRYVRFQVTDVASMINGLFHNLPRAAR